jgi:hypothetical protein
MTGDQTHEPAPALGEIKKIWVEPELEVFRMSEAESAHPLVTTPDLISGES